MTPPYQCKYCGMPSWIEPHDQEAPPDYCHESDHGSMEAYLEFRDDNFERFYEGRIAKAQSSS